MAAKRFNDPEYLAPPNDWNWSTNSFSIWFSSAKYVVIPMIQKLKIFDDPNNPDNVANYEKAYNLCKNLWYYDHADEETIQEELEAFVEYYCSGK